MTHLTRAQRLQIAEGIRLGKSNARIARELGVAPSTVGREIKRNAESRKEYSAAFAHTMAASRQIQAARERFAGAAEEPKPTARIFRFSPYQELCLPALAYWRPLVSGRYAPYLSTSSFYFYYKDQYLVFTRFGQQPGLFRPSGRKLIAPFSAYDYRCRTDIHAASSQTSDSFSFSQSASRTAGSTYFSQSEITTPAVVQTVSKPNVFGMTHSRAIISAVGRAMQNRGISLLKNCSKDSHLPVKMISPLAEGWNFRFSA